MYQKAQSIVKEAGSVLKDRFGKVKNISYKGKIDLVTEVDHLIEEMMVNALQKAYPGTGILAEERAELNKNALSRWILDPLDGTTNFAHGYPCFCISLALEERGEIVWGIVFDPLLEECFTAQNGKGAFLNGTRIRVSETDRIDRAFLCTGFPYDVHDSAADNIDHFKKFVKSAQAVRRDGSAAIDLCYVAAGRFDGFWEMKLKPWDIAAGALIVKEAGGRVTGFNGQGLELTDGDVLSSNGILHDRMVDILSTQGNAL